MVYKPMRQGRKWTTPTTQANGNGGLHDQSQFKDSVEMLETAIATWHEPRLMHLILTGCSSTKGYALFIDKLKRYLPPGASKAYKVGLETSANRGGFHAHLMLIVDSTSPPELFDLTDDSSALSSVRALLRRKHPDFEVTLAQPFRHHATPYIPLSLITLQDAADWLSYALKARSKPATGQCYLSSRRHRRSRCDVSSQ